jgi:hypothetical protein
MQVTQLDDTWVLLVHHRETSRLLQSGRTDTIAVHAPLQQPHLHPACTTTSTRICGVPVITKLGCKCLPGCGPGTPDPPPSCPTGGPAPGHHWCLPRKTASLATTLDRQYLREYLTALDSWLSRRWDLLQMSAFYLPLCSAWQCRMPGR